MRNRFSFPRRAAPVLAAAAFALLFLPAASQAQTTQSGTSVSASTSTDKQPQESPVAPTQSDGKSGQSARPWPTDATSAADPGLSNAPQ